MMETADESYNKRIDEALKQKKLEDAANKKEEIEAEKQKKIEANNQEREKRLHERLNDDELLEKEISDSGFDSLKLDPWNIPVFWYWQPVNKQGDKELIISHRKFIDFVRSCGYRRYDIGTESIFVYLELKIIKPVTVKWIQDFVMDWTKRLPYNWMKENSFSKSLLIEKIMKSQNVFFNDTKLSMLGVEKNLVLNFDTKENCYIYYNNVAVCCSEKGAELLSYSELNGYVFNDQIKQRNFEFISGEGMFSQFIRYVTERKNIDGTINESGSAERYNSLRTIIGYLMHSFYESKMKAVNLTDSVISDSAEGRTGKTLLGTAISHMKNLCTISGKDFDPSNKHKYSEANLDTQVIFLNDLRKKFDFESLFNDISDGITVDKKNQHPFKIRAKILISSNSTFRVEGASAKDRVIEFEFSDHYSDTHSPEDDFNKVWFFSDQWDETEWLLFDNFMVGCIVEYMRKGILEVEPINLIERKLIEHTNPDFKNFIDNAIKGEFQPDIILKNDYDVDKKSLHQKFLDEYPDYKKDAFYSNQGNFIKKLKVYAAYSPLMGPYHKERKSGNLYLIRFSAHKMTDDDFENTTAEKKTEKQLNIF